MVAIATATSPVFPLASLGQLKMNRSAVQWDSTTVKAS
jgi:hypothetical protein